MTTEQAKETAQITLEQLGGDKFIVMTRARNLAFNSDGSLSFKLPAKWGCNYVKITLNGLDLYDMEFRQLRIVKRELTNRLISEHNNVYFDMIRGIFEKETGLRTSLTAVHA